MSFLTPSRAGPGSWIAGAASEDAVELLALIARHIATPPIVRQDTGQRLAELAAALPPDQFAAARRRGESLELAGWLAGHGELIGDV